MIKFILIAVITLSFHSAKAETVSENITTESESIANLGESREIASENSENVETKNDETKTPSAEGANKHSAVVPADQPTSEPPTAEGVAEVTTPSADESTTSNAAAVGDEKKTETPELPEMNCSDMFLQWIRQQPAKNQENYLEAYFLSTAWNTYRRDKQDEFVWREKEAVYKKNFKDLLAQKSKTYVLRANVTLGKYDFKKKGFPVEIKSSKEGVLQNMDSGAAYLSFSMARIPDAGEIYCRGRSEELKFPSQLRVAIQKIQGPKFLAVNEEQGKDITGRLGTSRQVTSTFEVDVVSLIAKPDQFNKKEQYFSINTKLKNAIISIGEGRFEYKF